MAHFEIAALEQFMSQNAERISAVHEAATVVDAEIVSLILPTVHFEVPAFQGKSYLDRAIAAGVTAVNTSMGTGGLCSGRDDLRTFLHSAYGYLAYFDLHPDKLVHVETVADLEQAKADGKLGVIFGIQGLASKLEGDITLIRVLAKVGLRIAQLTNNERGPIGSGVMEPTDAGLSIYGKGCVRELQRVGVVVDLAHAGPKTITDTFEAATKPCIISHANVRALCGHPRNITDDTLRELARNGGVIGVTAIAEFNQKKRGDPATLNDLVDHIAHVADLVGIEHVGIGSDQTDAESEIRHEDFVRLYPQMQGDFHYGNTFVEGFERIDHFPRITAALLQRGFSDEDVKKVMGGNFLRVFRQCWRS